MAPEQGQQATHDHDEQDCPTFFAGALLISQKGSEWIKRDDNDKAVVAAFTIVLAISTIGLWLATIDLYRAGERQLDFLKVSAAAQSEEMQASIAAAVSAAEAAIASNQISVVNAEQQLRAYVTAKEMNLILHRGPSFMSANGPAEGPVHTYGIAPVLFNGGQTPATNVTINASTRQFVGSLPEGFDFPDSDNYGHGVIGPQSELHGPEAQIFAGELDPDLHPGNWFTWGWVEYDDVFSGTLRHRTEFCFEIQRRRVVANAPLWVGFRPIDRFNRVDGDCMRLIDPAA